MIFFFIFIGMTVQFLQRALSRVQALILESSLGILRLILSKGLNFKDVGEVYTKFLHTRLFEGNP